MKKLQLSYLCFLMMVLDDPYAHYPQALAEVEVGAAFAGPVEWIKMAKTRDNQEEK